MYITNLLDRMHQYTIAENTSTFINVAFIIAGVTLGAWICAKAGHDISKRMKVLSNIEVGLVILVIASGIFSPVFNHHTHVRKYTQAIQTDVHMEKIGESQGQHSLSRPQRDYLAHHKFRAVGKPKFYDYL